MFMFADISTDSGNKWKKAPPIMVPAERLTKINNASSSNFSLRDRVKIPTRDMQLTRKVLASIKIITLIEPH